MAGDIYSSVVSGVVGAFIGAAVTWNKDRVAARQHIMDFLLQKRLDLDSTPEYLDTIRILNDERAGKRAESFDGSKLRNLPAFLEPIGTYLMYNPATFRKAYGYFSGEVLLCAESTLMWEGDLRYDESVYWRSFSKFVHSTRKAGYRLDTPAKRQR